MNQKELNNQNGNFNNSPNQDVSYEWENWDGYGLFKPDGSFNGPTVYEKGNVVVKSIDDWNTFAVVINDNDYDIQINFSNRELSPIIVSANDYSEISDYGDEMSLETVRTLNALHHGEFEIENMELNRDEEER